MEEKWWQKDSKIPIELNDVPIMENKSEFIKNSEWNELHDKLVKDIIEFFKDKGIPEDSWAVYLSFDDIESSTKYGQWCPMSDSALELVSKNKETILLSM